MINKDMDNFKIGLCVTLNPSFNHIFFIEDTENDFQNISQIGYKGIELSLRDRNDIDWNHLNKNLQKNELELVCLSTGLIRSIDNLSLIDQDNDKRKMAIDRIISMIELLGNCRSSYKNILVGYTKGTISEFKKESSIQIERLKDSLNQLIQKAEENDVVVGIEVINHMETNFINNVSSGLELISHIKSKNLKLILDTYHMNIEEKNIVSSIKKAGENISYVHLCDSNRGFPGSGNINFYEIIKSLKEINYHGYLTMEFKSSEDKFLSIKKGFKYINEVIKKLIDKV